MVSVRRQPKLRSWIYIGCCEGIPLSPGGARAPRPALWLYLRGQRPQDTPGSLQRSIDIRTGMGGADMVPFESRRQHEDALFAHGAAEAYVTRRVVAEKVGIAFDRPFHEIRHE